MSRRSRLLVVLALMVVSMFAGAPSADAALPNPCDLPGAGHVCDVPKDVLGGVADAAGDAVMAGVTTWVTHFAVWVTGRVGDLITSTSSPDVQAGWFQQQYSTMLAIAGALALPMLLLAVIQAVMRQDAAMLARSAFGYLPMAFILAAAAILGTQLLIQITDDLSLAVTHGLGPGNNLLERVGDAYSSAVDGNQSDAVPLFGAFLGALVLAVGSLVLWLELVIRDATIYIALFFLPLTFVAMVWPATSRYARRLVEFLVAVILSKLVIVSIISLATAALTNSPVMSDGASAVATSSDQVFERMVAGAALLLLAACSPFALLRAIPLIEGAAASVGQNRQTMGRAAAAAGVQTPAAYMRQAMNREPSGYAPMGSAGAVSTGGGAAAARGGAPSGGAASSWAMRDRGSTSFGSPATNGSSSRTAPGASSVSSSAGAPTPTATPAARPPSQPTPTPSPAAPRRLDSPPDIPEVPSP